jgi:hypothetical protein
MLIIKLRCARDHEQIIRFRNVDRTFAERLAGILDGTSPLYIYPPGPESTIAKCGLCLDNITATVEDDSMPAVDDNQEDDK